MRSFLWPAPGLACLLVLCLCMLAMSCDSVERIDCRSSVMTLHDEDAEPLLLKASGIVWFNGKLYVLDRDDWNIKVFTPGGECRKVIPVTRGQGPDELTLLTGICEDGGRLYVGGLKKVLLYSGTGELNRIIELPVPILSDFTVADGKLYTAALGSRLGQREGGESVPPQQPFCQVDLASGTVTRFGHVDYFPGPRMEGQFYYHFGKCSRGIVINGWFLPVVYVYQPGLLASGKKIILNNGTDYTVWSNLVEDATGNFYVMGLNRLSRTADLICLDSALEPGFIQQFDPRDFSHRMAISTDLNVFLLANQGTELKRSVISPRSFRNAGSRDFQRFLQAQVDDPAHAAYRDVQEVARGYLRSVQELGLKGNPLDSLRESLRIVAFRSDQIVLNSGETRMNLVRWNREGFRLVYQDEGLNPLHHRIRSFPVDSGWVVLCETYKSGDSHTVLFLDPDGRPEQETTLPWDQCPIGVTGRGDIVVYRKSSRDITFLNDTGNRITVPLTRAFPTDTQLLTSDLRFFQCEGGYVLWNGADDRCVWVNSAGTSMRHIDVHRMIQAARGDRTPFWVLDVNVGRRTLWVLTRSRKSKSSYRQLTLWAFRDPFLKAESRFACRIPGFTAGKVDGNGSILLMPWGMEAMYLIERGE